MTTPTANSSLPRIVGLDLSLTSTGTAIIDGRNVQLARLQPPDYGNDEHARIDWIRSRVWRLANGSPLFVIEQLAYTSITGKATERAGLWWICTRMLWRAGIPYAVVTPQQLKKYALGKGSGKGTDKDQVLAAAVRRYPMADTDGNDVADALILAAMGAHHLGHPLAPVPDTHAAALKSVTWPPIDHLAG